MIKLSEKTISQIAEELDSGMNVYVHRETREYKAIISRSDMEFSGLEECWEEDIREVEENLEDYIFVEKMTSSDAYKVMEQFATHAVENKKNQDRLLYALNQRKPFAKFRYEIDYQGGNLLEGWFKFKQRA
ncbi:MAG: UPF0158 family protein [Bacteroidota bacterium]